MFFNKHGVTVSITIDSGVIKLLVSEGLKVLGYKILPVNPDFYHGGLVSDTARVAAIIQNALKEMDVGTIRRVVSAAPGFQSNLRLLQLPPSRDIDPKSVIPREMRRIANIQLNTTQLQWLRLPKLLGQTRWLVYTATNVSITSLQNTIKKAGLRLREVDLRPFALARATNQPDAIIAWTTIDGDDVVIVRDSMPVWYISLPRGIEPAESTFVVERLSTLVDDAVAKYNASEMDGPLSKDTPLIVYGSMVASQPDIASRVASNLGRDIGTPNICLQHEEDFPIQDLIVNIGLALRHQ